MIGEAVTLDREQSKLNHRREWPEKVNTDF